MTISELYTQADLSAMETSDVKILRRELLREATVNGNGRIVAYPEVYAKYKAASAEYEQRGRVACV